jgi:hypothetical protein
MNASSQRRRAFVAVVAVLTLISVGTPTLDAQCAMCRTLLGTPEGQRMAGALRSGIWILLAAPFGAFAVIAVAAIRSRRRFLDRAAGGEPLTPR